MAQIYTRKGRATWYARYKDPYGNWIRLSTGVSAKAELREKAALAANQLELSAWENWHPQKKEEKIYSFDELFIGWIQETEPGPPDLNCIARLSAFFKGVDLSKLNGKHINAYIQNRKEQGISQSTIRRELSVFSSAINYARKHWEWDIENVVHGRKPVQNKSVVRWITKEEAGRLIKEARAETDHLADFIELALATGMRKQEILKLNRVRVDLKNRVVHLNPEDQKNGEYSTVPLNQTACSILKRRLSEPGEWVFEGKQGSPLGDLKKSFKTACKRAGIEKFRIHDLRHTFASWLVQQGVNLYTVKDLMRHASITTTQIYAHLAPSTGARAVEVIDRIFSPHDAPVSNEQDGKRWDS